MRFALPIEESSRRACDGVCECWSDGDVDDAGMQAIYFARQKVNRCRLAMLSGPLILLAACQLNVSLRRRGFSVRHSSKRLLLPIALELRRTLFWQSENPHIRRCARPPSAGTRASIRHCRCCPQSPVLCGLAAIHPLLLAVRQRSFTTTNTTAFFNLTLLRRLHTRPSPPPLLPRARHSFPHQTVPDPWFHPPTFCSSACPVRQSVSRTTCASSLTAPRPDDSVAP